MKPVQAGVYVALAAVGLVVVLFGVSLLPTGERTVRPLHNLHGVPYPVAGTGQLILEKLAHTDVYLREPVFAKQVVLDITFIPYATGELAVGVRRDPFWLSYERKTFFEQRGGEQTTPQTARVVIPVTDALQEADRSIDVMFFAGTDFSEATLDLGETDTTRWQLVSLQAAVLYSWPTVEQAKDYIRSIVQRERPL